jgi:uncharacterized protein YbjQ (UPF0145 family)
MVPDPSTSTRVRTSRLNGAESAALASVGFRPVGIMMAAVAFPTAFLGSIASSRVVITEYPYVRQRASNGFGPRMGGSTYSVPAAQDAARKAFTQAYDSIVEEARSAGAHGVVGVTASWAPLARTPHAPHRLTLTGTAVVAPAVAAPPTPFTTTLTAGPLVQLLLTGRVPVRIVSAFVCTSVFGGLGRFAATASVGNSWYIEPFSDAVDLARSTAVTEMSRQGAASGADEIIAINIERDTSLGRLRKGTLGELHAVRALGTATKRFETGLSRVGARQLFRLRTSPRMPTVPHMPKVPR